MKVTIDREDCTMCGVCWEECPDFFEQSDDDDLSRVVDEYASDDEGAGGKVPENLEDCVREAAEGCPVDIIHLAG